MNLYRVLQYKLERLKTKVSSISNRFYFAINGNSIVGQGLIVRGKVWIKNDGVIEIGDNVRINSSGWASPLGCGEKTYIQITREGKLKIGNGTGLSNCAITCASQILIGENVMIGGGVKIYDTDFHPLEAEYRFGVKRDDSKVKTKSICIEDGAFIGAGTFVLKGTHIGKNSIVGAGSVVCGNIPENEIWAGNPARFIRKVK